MASGPWCKCATGVGSLEPPSTKEDLHPWHDEYRLSSASAPRSTSCSAPTVTSRRSWRTSPGSACGWCSRPPWRPRSRSSWAGRATSVATTTDRPGSRNGHQPPMTVKTTMGAVELQRPKLRGTDQAFCSRLFGAGVTRTNALESLVISGWVRGLSDRDIEATLAEVLGPEAALSKSTVSRICAAIGDGVRRLADPRPVRGAAGLPVPGRQPLQDAPRRAGRAGAGRLGHRRRRQAGVRRPGAGELGVHRRLGRLPRRPQRRVACGRRCWGSATARPG